MNARDLHVKWVPPMRHPANGTAFFQEMVSMEIDTSRLSRYNGRHEGHLAAKCSGGGEAGHTGHGGRTADCSAGPIFYGDGHGSVVDSSRDALVEVGESLRALVGGAVGLCIRWPWRAGPRVHVPPIGSRVQRTPWRGPGRWDRFQGLLERIKQAGVTRR